jgi:hypothetical protein
MADRKEYLKQWRAKNKEKIQNYQAQYFQENKDTIYKQRVISENETGYKMKYNQQHKLCECGKSLKISSIYQHYRTCLPHKNSLPKSTLDS